ncbi:SHC-transforming protein 2 isoform 3-T4 [Megaptera novaeangliae]
MTQGPGGRAAPAPPAPPEPEAPTTFCALLPRMPQWKFAAPAGFLGRGPAAARAAGGAGAAGEAESESEPAASAGVPALAAAVLGACEPRCAAPCPLPALSRCRAAGARGSRGARGAAGPPDAAADEWIRKGSFIHKPAHGWLHPDARVLGPGVSYIVRYMGCIEVLRSMRSLDFSTRTRVTREAINRLHEAVPGIRGSWKKKAPNKALASILGKSNLRFAGMSVAVSISIDGLNLSVPATRQRQPRDWWSLFGQIIANHHMQSISFASGGDTDMADYVAYVAKDPINQRACHILECCEGLAQSVISTVGQAFELRFKQYLHSPPRVVVPPGRLTGLEDSAWGDEDETEHNYYNRTPGKEPPLGGLVDSRLTPAQQPCALGALGQVNRRCPGEQCREGHQGARDSMCRGRHSKWGRPLRLQQREHLLLEETPEARSGTWAPQPRPGMATCRQTPGARETTRTTCTSTRRVWTAQSPCSLRTAPRRTCST